MKQSLLALLTATTLMVAPAAYAFKTGNPAAGDGSVVVGAESTSLALKLVETMNRGGNYGRDFYRNTFMQIMGLVFFDPNTPDIKACQKEVLNYHLPELTASHVSLDQVKRDVARVMAETYTKEEIEWLDAFYKSPFGARMLRKQLTFNERLTRMLSNRYGKLRPEFQRVYTRMAEECDGIKPSTQEPRQNKGISGNDILSVPGIGAAPIPNSPEPGMR